VSWEGKEWVCLDREPLWCTEVTHNRMSKILDTCFSKDIHSIAPSDSGKVTRRTLPEQFSPKADPDEIHLMTDNHITGTEGHYMPRESFLYLRKCERMIEKITLPTPIHLLDHIIIPTNVRQPHWFPAHINLQTRSFGLLDSSQDYSMASFLPTTENAHLEILSR